MSNSITPTITRVGQFGSLINAYLVHEDDGLTLIDGLQGNQSKRILAAAEAIGKPIVRVTLTHAHPDHVGAVDPLLAKLPGAEFIVGRRESKVLNAKPALEPGEPTDGKLMPRGGGVRSTPARTIEHGELIGSLKAIWSPGHSVGHLSFFDTRDGALICGDVYSTVGGLATTAGPFWRFRCPACSPGTGPPSSIPRAASPTSTRPSCFRATAAPSANRCLRCGPRSHAARASPRRPARDRRRRTARPRVADAAPAPRRARLNRAQVLRAAADLADRDGLDATP